MNNSHRRQKVYIIKNLAPWMFDELVTFSDSTKFDIVFLREQKDFYVNEFGKLNTSNVSLYVTPHSYKYFFKKVLFAIKFILLNLSKFDFKYSGVIGLKSIIWFLKLDITKFSKDCQMHAQFATQSALIALLIKKYYDDEPEYSFTYHAHDIFFKNKWFNTLIENSFRCFSISEFNIKYIEENYKTSHEIVLSRLGVFRNLVKREKKSFNNQIFVIGLMSWFMEKKGIIYLLEAMKILNQRKNEHIKLKLAGDGPLREQILNFIEENNLGKTVEYVGKVKSGDKSKFYESLDTFILPSINLKDDMDGIPVVLMEAIAYGLPIISTNLSGIPEICINNYNGFLIQEKNVKEIVDSILDISSNNDKRIQFSHNSSLLSKEYDIEKNSFNKIKILNWLND